MQSLRSVAVILFLVSAFITIDGQQAPTLTCGRRIASVKPLIVNSLPTSHWPWHAAIYHLDDSNVPRYQCGGTIISSNSVITAGHCVSSDNALLDTARVSLALGRSNLAVSESSAQPSRVAKIILHPNFSSIDLANDIAIIQLSTDADFNNYVQPICLWPANRLKLSEVIGKGGTVVGWGKTETGTASNILRKALLPVVDSLDCLHSNRPVFGYYLSKTNFCAGLRNGTGICDGDSGGSMTFEENGQFFIRGIVSLSVAKPREGSQETDCDPSHYAIFTDVAQYLPWIAEVTKGFVKASVDAKVDAQFVPSTTEKTNECIKNVKCDGVYSNYNRVMCDVHLNIALSERNCKIILDEHSDARVRKLNINGESDAFPDLSDAVNKFENLTELSYEDSNMKAVERSKLAAFKRVEILALNYNEISELSGDTFTDLENLIQLGMSNNKLREVHRHLLMDLTNLKIIYFAYNQIEALPEGLLQNNRKLESISFSNNKIKIIPPDLLKYLSNLKYIYFAFNQIDTLPEGLLQNNEMLDSILFNNNLIKFVPPNLFKNVPNLKQLSLNYNQIENLDAQLLQNNIKLESILFSENKIQIIPAVLFMNLPNLKELFLDSNQIDLLPNDLFRNNRALQQIEVQNNQLKELHADLFMNVLELKSIDLSDNQLEVLPEGLFRNNQKLIEIRLQSNKLKIIKLELQHLPNLEFVNLLSNVCIDEFCYINESCGKTLKNNLEKCL